MIQWIVLLAAILSLPINHEFRLVIPTAKIDTPLTRFYLDGVSWEINPWEKQVGHLEGTAWINGNVVLGGHSLYPNKNPGVFGALNKIALGDKLTLAVGLFKREYTVIEIFTVSETDLSVLYPTFDNRLTLITCDETSFNPRTGLYGERLVVVAVETTAIPDLTLLQE